MRRLPVRMRSLNGADAATDGGDPAPDGHASQTQLGDFVGTVRVGIPHDAARQLAGVDADGLLADIVFVGEPKDAVVVEAAPDGGEGVAVAEVDAAAEPLERGSGAGDDAFGQIGIDEPLEHSKLQQYSWRYVASPIARRSFSRCSGLRREILLAGTSIRFQSAPPLGPGVVEKAALALRRGEGDEASS